MKKRVNNLTFYFSLFTILLLANCGEAGSDGLPQIEDSSVQVTLTPEATVTVPATAVPTASDAEGIALAFFRAWEGFDYLGMYSLLSPTTQAVVDSRAFTERYEQAMQTATVRQIRSQPLAISQEGNRAELSIRVTWETAVIGSITRDFVVPLRFESERWGVIWNEGLILPELSGGNRLFLNSTTPARANIYDINGRALAYQGDIFSLGVIPGQIEDEAGLLNALSPVLNLPPDEIKAIYEPALPDWYWPIGDVSAETLQANIGTLQPFIGRGLVQPEPRLTRIYSDRGIAPHIVGYTGFIPAESLDRYLDAGYAGDEQVGLVGVEQWGEDYLNGERGGTLTVVGPNGDYISTIQEVQSRQARSVYTSIDLDFQAAVEEALASAVLNHPAGDAGAVVVMDVNTGAIRAMASYPTYDPNVFDLAQPNADERLGQLFSNPLRPLVNRATQGAFPAGSLFKIVTLTAGLNSGLYTTDSLYTSTGTWNRLGDNFIKTDWREGGHGTVSLANALVVSCNSCFYDVAYNLDLQDPAFFPTTARSFGLGTVTGIEGLNEASGTIPGPEWKINNIGEGWVTGDAVNMGIGQGFVEVTPLQMVNIFAAIANGGTVYQPTVIDRIGSGGGAPEEKLPVQINGDLPINANDLATIQSSLWRVTNDINGTAADRMVGLPLQVAGKTGTAEAPPDLPHSWFGGYAPAGPYTKADGTAVNSPEIAIVVIMENAGEGSEVAAPIFRRIVELYYGIQPITPYPWGG